jgi:hypothetical protein
MHRPSTLLCTLVLLAGLPLTSRHRADAQVPVPSPKATDSDSGGDGLSDFQKVHKYFIDPHKKSAAGKHGSDSDWEERREFTYSVRAVIRIMPPYNLAAINDDYQDVRVRSQTKDYAEIEVVSYPLNTNGEAITANPNWRKDYAGMKEYLQPGVTTNWDDGLRKDLLAALAKDGIDVDKLTDKEVVEKVARWILGRCSYKPMFCTMFVDFPGGKKATVLPGVEQAFQREKGDGKWTTEEQLAHEVFGKEMFYHRTRGSCTSSAVLLTTVLRALGIPTRMITAIPIADANDPEQIALVEKGIRHHQVRVNILNGLRRAGRGFANHTYNEVFVGNRWRRLNYHQLGQNILDEKYFGLMIHVHTFNDLSEARLAPTWGRRYALGLRDENFKTGNPYRLLEISDHFGRESKVPNPPFERKEHKSITITKAYWLQSTETPESIRQGARKPRQGEAHLYIHGDEWFPDRDKLQYQEFIARADKTFILRAKGHPEVKGALQMSFWADGPSNLREILMVVPKGEFAKMAKDVAYSIHPVNSVADYQWKVKEGLTVTRPATLEQKEHKFVTITKIYWLRSEETNEQIRQAAPRPTQGEGQLLIHGEEWFPEQDHVQYREFMIRADKDFVFQAEGHPDVKAKINAPYGAFWTSSHDNLREILVVIPKDELAKMAKDVAYTIRPVNSVATYQWKVKEGLTITRQPSLEEKFDALQRRFDQLEKRLGALEKERAKR